jgi:Hydrazine synthase alpha subunit middle domain/IPT/TIG domain
MSPNRHVRLMLALVLALCGIAAITAPITPRPALAAGPTLPNPILFVTHVPTPYDVVTTVTTFNNHTGDVHAAGRGGDLWLRYADGTLKNITALAGYGVAFGLQGANSIAVRDPSVSWDGTKALFSMVIGAPTQATSAPPNYFWQIYEITNLGQIVQNQNAAPIIQKVPNQPANYNNITPIYGTNGRIIFTSDLPRNGQAYLYPLLDEYNMRPTNSGLWNLDPTSGDLFQMDSSPSGDFTPIIDSFGRVIFIRWDHLERDQQTDVDALAAQQNPPQPCKFCTFNYSDESAQAAKLATNAEVFPEPRPQRTDLLASMHAAGHHMNEFLPWQIREDGTAPETINHIGRHELLAHIPAAFTNDPNLQTLNGAPANAANQNRITKFLQIREDPLNPGTYYGVDVLELTHASGQIIKLAGAPSLNGDQMAITYITHRETISTTLALTLPNSDGHYRDPLPMTDGTLIASYTTNKHFESYNPGNLTGPSAFDFRLYTMGTDPINPQFKAHSQLITAGVPTKTLDYFDRTLHISRTNLQLWEIQPVEVYARQKPAAPGGAPLGTPEQNAFTAAGVTPAQLQSFLAQNNLALIVSRNVTTRDHSDVQQPFRLQVGTNGAITAPGSGTLYQINNLQLFQADQLRGMNGSASVPAQPGRRVLAEPLHDPTTLQYNPANPGGPSGSVALGNDGSMAAFVPARRGVTWQLTDSAGTPVVRERFWLTMQPGEIRVCASCHGINQTDQNGQGVPTNTPQALTQLLQTWKQVVGATPTISNLSPALAAVGGASFTLTVNGTNFANNAAVQWNGANRTTTFVSSTQLTAQISAVDIAAVGSASITVTNPSASTISAAAPFTIAGGIHWAYLPVALH